MELRISRFVAGLAWLTCVICPVLELFDRWDHTLQTGQDTEYSFVLLALCLGAAYALARLVLKFSLARILRKFVATSPLRQSLLFRGSGCFIVVPVDGSPPLLALRI